MEPRNELPKPTTLIGLSEAATIAVSTGFAYCVSWVVAFGETQYLGIPKSLIHVDTAQLITFAVACFLILGFPLLHLMGYRAPTVNLSKTPLLLGAIYLLNVIYCFITMENGVVSVRDPASLLPVFLVVPFALTYLWPILIVATEINRRRGSINIRVLNRFLRKRSRVKFGFLGFTDSPRGSAYFFLLNAALFILCSARASGYSIVAGEHSHYIISRGPYSGYAITWIVDDVFVLQSYDRQKRQLSCDVVVIKLDKDQPIAWRLVETGLLDDVYSTPQKVATSACHQVASPSPSGSSRKTPPGSWPSPSRPPAKASVTPILHQ